MKPMLAAPADLGAIQFPVMVSPKFDGVRCLISSTIAVSRSLKSIPNVYTQKLFGREKYHGLDGELIVGDPTAKDVYQRTMSGVMTGAGEPDVWFHVFDDFSCDGIFSHRSVLAELRCQGSVKLIYTPHKLVSCQEELIDFEHHSLAAGYEGIMIRDPLGAYKYGRSTVKEGGLLKLKRFTDSEAVVTGFTQLMSNQNEAVVNELGQLERSHKKAGMVPMKTLGALVVCDLKSGVEFEIGSGYTEAQRKELWSLRAALVGKLVKYKSQDAGVKIKPRFPVFIGFRDPLDTGE